MADEIVGSEFSRELVIKFPNNPEMRDITGEHILQESFTLKEAICDSEEFKFGGCISSSLEVELLNINPDTIKNKTIQVNFKSGIYGVVIYPGMPDENWSYPSDRIYPGMHYEYYGSTPLFYGRVEDVKRQNDRQISKVTAYDELRYICDKNIYTYLSSFVERSGKNTTFNIFAQRVAQYIDDSQGVIPTTLEFERKSPAQPDRALSLKLDRFKDVFKGTVNASEMLGIVCEYAGGFGHFDPRNNKLEILRFPSKDKTKTITEYSNLSFEEFITLPFGKYSCQFGDDSSYSSRFGNRLVEYSTYSASNQLLDCIEDSHTDYAYNFLEGVSQGFVAKYLSGTQAEMAAETFRPNSIYLITSTQIPKVKDLPSGMSNTATVITFGGERGKSPNSADELYANQTGTDAPVAGTTQMLFADNGLFYQRLKKSVNQDYSDWRKITTEYDTVSPMGNAPTPISYSYAGLKPNSIFRSLDDTSGKISDKPSLDNFHDSANHSIITLSPYANSINGAFQVITLLDSDDYLKMVYRAFSNSGSPGNWYGVIDTGNLNHFIQKDEYIKSLEARITAIEKQ